MQTVYLKGNLAQFGEVWEVNCSKLIDIFRLIKCQTPGFEQYLINIVENKRGISIVKGKDVIDSVENLFMPDLKNEDIIITEVPSGSDDAIDFIVAAVAIAIFVKTGAETFLKGKEIFGTAAADFLGLLSVNFALTGISMMLAPGPETDIPDQLEEEAKGKLFDGPANVAKQDIPIPLLYGELLVGGATIYSSVITQDSGLALTYQNKFSEILTFGAIS